MKSSASTTVRSDIRFSASITTERFLPACVGPCSEKSRNNGVDESLAERFPRGRYRECFGLCCLHAYSSMRRSYSRYVEAFTNSRRLIFFQRVGAHVVHPPDQPQQKRARS